MFDSAFAEDATGRFSEERGARLIEGVRVERVAELHWSPEIVKARLSEATIACERLGGMVGPRNKLTSWDRFSALQESDSFDAKCLS